MLDLLQKWEIGDLRPFFVNMPEPMLPDALNSCDFLSVVVSREDVEAGDISSTMNVLQRLLASPATARKFFGRVDIMFDGYNGFAAELFEISEVRTFVYKLDEKFPFWLFFLSKHHLGLQCLLFCL